VGWVEGSDLLVFSRNGFRMEHQGCDSAWWSYDAILPTAFRREPTSVSEERLSTPMYSRRLCAARNFEELRQLRDRFYWRIIHTSYESWKRDLQEALVFDTRP